MKFTETALKKLKPKAIRYEVAEANGRGFRLRVYPSGRKSFIARYRFGAASRVAVYGSFPAKTLAEAHAEHGALLLALERGVRMCYHDGAGARRARSPGATWLNCSTRWGTRRTDPRARALDLLEHVSAGYRARAG